MSDNEMSIKCSNCKHYCKEDKYCFSCKENIEDSECCNCHMFKYRFPTVQIKQLTIEELREQFESYLYQSCIPTIRNNFPKNTHGDYKFSTDQIKWESFKGCARANNIIKESK